MRCTFHLVLILAACLGPASVALPAEGEQKPAGHAFAPALRNAIDGKTALREVRIAGSYRDGINFVIYGRGIAFVKGAQITLTQEQVTPILRRVEKAAFAAMPDHFGGIPAGNPGGPRPMRPVQFIGRLGFRISDVEKTVTQLGEGEQSQALLELIKGIEADLLPGIEKGLKLEGLSLKAAMAKLAAGELAPEAMTLAFTCSPRQANGNGGNWVMVMEGGRLRMMASWIDIPQNEIDAMAKRLGTLFSAMELDKFPRQLHHPTSLIGVNLSVQCVRAKLDVSADVGPYNQQQKQLHPDAQQAFAALLAEVVRIHDAAKARQTKVPS